MLMQNYTKHSRRFNGCNEKKHVYSHFLCYIIRPIALSQSASIFPFVFLSVIIMSICQTADIGNINVSFRYGKCNGGRWGGVVG